MIRKTFGRSFSFPFPNPSIPQLRSRVGPTTVISDQISALLTWRSQSKQSPSDFRSWILAGLSELDRLHSSLLDLLRRPQARSGPIGPDNNSRALDDFIRLADAYCSLRSSLSSLSDRHVAVKSAIRRKDASRISSSIRDQRKALKDLIKISSSIRTAGRWGPRDDVAGVVREVAAVTAMVTEAVTVGIAELSAGATSAAAGSYYWAAGIGIGLGRKRKVDKCEDAMDEAMERLERVEECVGEVEKGCQKMFRNLLNSRVLMLNTLTPCL